MRRAQALVGSSPTSSAPQNLTYKEVWYTAYMADDPGGDLLTFVVGLILISVIVYAGIATISSWLEGESAPTPEELAEPAS